MRNILILQLLIVIAHANLYDPHQYPNQGPFFEGWYSRFQDADSKVSFGLLFGKVLAAPNSKIETSEKIYPAYCSILFDKGDGSPIRAFDGFPDVNEYKVTDLEGNEVHGDPSSMGTNVGFIWQAENFGKFVATQEYTEFDFAYGDIEFKGKLSKPRPYGPNGEGPAGWTDILPLPLHWFVHSLGSPIEYISFKNKKTGENVQVKNGSGHQEKNWGNAFPKAWIWVQATNEKQKASFVMSGGPLGLVSDLSVQAHLIGLRAPGLSINMHPQDSIVEKNVDACGGKLTVTAQNLQYKIEFVIQAHIDSFAGLLGPSELGFQLMCYESYSAIATAKVYQKEFLNEKLILTQDFSGAALEFGGDFACSKK